MSNNGSDFLTNEHSCVNLEMLINHTNDPIWLVDTDLVIQECNCSFRRWVAHFIGAGLGKGDDVLFGKANASYTAKFEMCYQVAMSGKSFSSVEDMQVDGETRYTAITFNPVCNDAGAVVGVSCIARDITEQRRHIYQIEQQNLALRDIASTVSHKVRGPVATILGLQQLFNHDNPADQVNGEIVRGITDVIHALDGIICEVVRRSNLIEAEAARVIS